MDKNEFEVMKTIEELLLSLDEQIRTRVLTWVHLRFSGNQFLSMTTAMSSKENIHALPVFETFADLINECEPQTIMDRALVGAYWVQVINGEKSWRSLQINALMSKIDMRIPNINHVMSRAQKKKPALILVVEKNGQSAQTQKRYKLTSAGTEYVENMLSKDDSLDV